MTARQRRTGAALAVLVAGVFLGVAACARSSADGGGVASGEVKVAPGGGIPPRPPPG